jgi:hypothetical protein
MTRQARETRGFEVGRVPHRAAAWLAWSVCAASLLLMGFSLLLTVLGWSTPLPRGWSPWHDKALSLVSFVGAPVLGAVIVSRRPENPYGWLWLSLGLVFAFLSLAEPYAAYALVAEPGSLPAPRTVNAVLAMGWVVLVTMVPFVLLLFPTGRLPSRRWRFLAWVIVAAGAVMLPLGFFSSESGQGPVENPFAVGGAVGEAMGRVVLGAIMIVFSSVIVSALSLVVRYHRAGGVERQQLKWFALAAVLNGALIVVDQLTLDRLLGNTLWNLLDAATTAALYVAVGVAILRHRLYDIDVIINRTLVYGSLTAMLVLVYLGGVISLQYVFRTLTGQGSQLAIVASTLGIAALFNPLRGRIQAIVDRRFYRSRYDARKTIESFSAKLRDETDLEALNADLVGVVRDTMQPAHVSVWLRPSEMVRSRESPG